MFPFNTENFVIFLENLSAYHVFFNLVSFVAFALSVFFLRKCNIATSGNLQQLKRRDSISGISEPASDDHRSSGKFYKQKDLLEAITANLTENEKEEEKRVEKIQLEKIFDLLKQQEEKFQMSSMEQLQDQLSLYRI